MNKRSNRLLLAMLVFLLATLNSCDFVENTLNKIRKTEITEDVVAKIGSNVLYVQDLQQVTRVAANAEDSALIADKYIRQWATDILLYDEAKRQIGKSEDIDRMVEEYRRSLYVHRYEDRLLTRHLNTNVPQDTLLSYYEQHQNDFVLDEDIIKGIIIVLPESSPNQKDLTSWLKNYEEDIDQIEHYAYQYAVAYQLFLDDWQTLTKVTLHTQLDQETIHSQLQKNNLFEVSDSLHTSFLRITEQHLKGELMPFDYAEQKIRQIIIDRRKIYYINNYETSVYDKWKSDN